MGLYNIDYHADRDALLDFKGGAFMISGEGLCWLWDQRKVGQDLPDSWPQDAQHYIAIKKGFQYPLNKTEKGIQIRKAEALVTCLLLEGAA